MTSLGDKRAEDATLREAFAMAVDPSPYMPVQTFEGTHGRKPSVNELASWIAQIKVIQADALLLALTQETRK